jgi:addiction module HigA family antidote
MTIGLPTHRAPTTPGEMLLEEFLKPLGLTQTEVAERMQVPLKRLNAIIRGRKAVTPDTALRLERLFGMEAQFWLNLQLGVDLYRAMHSPTAAAIRKLRPVPGIDAHSDRVA